MLSLVCCLLFFFFQAEDGIRDHCVTGVQTCALPICGPVETREGRRFPPPGARTASDYAGKCAASVPLSALPLHGSHAPRLEAEELDHPDAGRKGANALRRARGGRSRYSWEG